MKKTAIANFFAAAGLLFASTMFVPQQHARMEMPGFTLAQRDLVFCDPAPRLPGPADEFYSVVDDSTSMQTNIYDLVDCFRRELESS